MLEAYDAVGGAELKTVPLFEMAYGLNPTVSIGPTAFGHRFLFSTSGGRFRGERLSGEVVAGGSDWALLGADGSSKIDADLVLQTDDGALIHASWFGRLSMVDATMFPLLADPVKRADLPPSDYNFHVTPSFETSEPAYAWLNKIVCVARARFLPNGLGYIVHQLV